MILKGDFIFLDIPGYFQTFFLSVSSDAGDKHMGPPNHGTGKKDSVSEKHSIPKELSGGGLKCISRSTELVGLP